ncbi:GntR family transcriptional regulator [Sphingosinicella rhizophila]|uniref:GntR family transcriptional regulator n=1 Tax=Sphingosinicella rhizophila TaxID=3050082 RepID=A0ABU3QAU4_9SPHN|nr:GntR family transcriptional regulator [Sphingosinicella sp. GR2756]MDT9600528.1 GntR family transcriptional regulator [Sphingosinicella sp. GR2756]
MYTPRQQAVVDNLRHMILGGILSGGERLLEIPLSERMEVSRTPVREALITLAEEGLVEYRPNRGYIVRAFTGKEIEDAYTVRGALESLACRLLAEKGIDAETQKAFEACLDDGDRLLSVERLTESAKEPWREINDRFHKLIIGSLENSALSSALARVTNIPFASSRVVHWFDEGDVQGLFQLRLTHSQHHSVYEAIKAGQGYRAEVAMGGHIEFAASHIKSTYFAAGEVPG